MCTNVHPNVFDVYEIKREKMHLKMRFAQVWYYQIKDCIVDQPVDRLCKNSLKWYNW